MEGDEEEGQKDSFDCVCDFDCGYFGGGFCDADQRVGVLVPGDSDGCVLLVHDHIHPMGAEDCQEVVLCLFLVMFLMFYLFGLEMW